MVALLFSTWLEGEKGMHGRRRLDKLTSEKDAVPFGHLQESFGMKYNCQSQE